MVVIWWPRTLLEYPVQLSAGASASRLSLIDESGKAIPFQLANVQAQ
jgi:hypothetical protein